MTDSAQHLFDLAQEKTPLPLRATVESAWHGLREHFLRQPAAVAELWVPVLPRVFAASEFVTRTCVQNPEVLRELIDSRDLFRAYAAGELMRRAERELGNAAEVGALKARLRWLRRREMLRIAWRDLAGLASLDEVVATVSDLADACLTQACARLHDWACAKYGEPRGAAGGAPQSLVVLGLGKLGGRELNFSSDIDLIFAYPEDGETRGERVLSNHEFFVRLGQSLIAALNDVTADGFVFRVDMRLRPNGASGPLALSFDAMEQYYQAHGRMWERYALIKARCVAGDMSAGAELLTRLKPFVFRRYLDYGAVEEIRGMKLAIHRELLRKGIEDNIKLGPGGIREIEFVGQAFQLIRGGRDARLQERRILPVLAQLGADGDLTAQAVAELAAAYEFLRNTEHRLQMIGDQQTQVLPVGELDRLRVTVGMGFGDWDAFRAVLTRHMRRVHEHFQSVFAAPQGEAPAAAEVGLHALWAGTLDDAAAAHLLAEAGYADAEAALGLLRGLREGGAWSALSAQGRERLDKLMPLLIAAAGLTLDANTTLARLVRLIEAIGRRSVYLALLVENPIVLSQLVKLCAASDWIAQYLARHPVLLDELMDPAALVAPVDRAALAAELESRLARLPVDDLEAQMDVLREFRHGHVLRVAAADLYASTCGAGLPPETIGRHLGEIAEVIVERALALAFDDLVAKHGRPTLAVDGETVYPGFVVVAYGKLGSLELGYTSDLDIIFLHGAEQEGGQTDGPRPVANEVFFARLAQRLIHVLTTRTGAGILYEVDMRLRPSGRSGLLVTHLPAFRQYQESSAWVWEHQALIRARPVAGDPDLARRFEDIRAAALCRARDPEQVRAEVQAMRLRMHEARAPHDPGQFDLKHDAGGMIDVEFMVQYSVLRWAQEHPGLIRHRGNLPLLEALQSRGLLEAADAGLLRTAYRNYLAAEQRFKLMERRPLVAVGELGELPARVSALWQRMIENK